jgi:malto-oligosyltrehalose synthase
MRPASTYRLQLHAGFTLHDAAAIVPYLVRLGVGALYLSPVWHAVPGSQHGYDVLAPDEVNPELGGLPALEALALRAHEVDLGIVLDFVPNHQAADPRNPRWRAVLLDGEASPFAHWFDIDWRGNELVPPGKVLLPVLGSGLRDALAGGSVRLVADGEVYAFALGELRYPVRGPVGPDARSGAVDALLEVADRQAYVLCDWRRARTARNYRRFFDVDGLVGVRVEQLDVFAATHELVIDLVRRGVADGVRIDHIDGLADPGAYLERLSRALPRGTLTVVEKILGVGEQLPAWPVDGTTGYEWAALLHGAQIDAEGRRVLLDGAARDGIDTDFAVVQHTAKRAVLDGLFAGEWARLTTRVPGDEQGALHELTVSLDVYRTYLGSTRAEAASDGAVLARASDLARACGASPDGVAAVIERLAGECELARRWQQLTAPVMAKGHEDTACYRYPVLVSQCEVGSDPSDDAVGGVARLHRAASAAAATPRRGLLATATHDTKRGEGTRARLAALSECADAFEAALAAWRATERSAARDVASADQRFLAQTLLGAWPLVDAADHDAAGVSYSERLAGYLRKALREAKLRSSWLEPDEPYEQTVIDAARAAIDPDSAFRRAFAPLRAPLELAGAVNELSQLVLKVALPGIPDVYRGCETWDLSLVDPDNRRPVDHPRFAVMLEAQGTSPDWFALRRDWRDGAIKLVVTARLLRARRVHDTLFVRGAYAGATAVGAAGDHVIVARRELAGMAAVAIATRLPLGLAPDQWPVGEAWGDTTVALDRAPWDDAITANHVAGGDAVRLRDVLRELPVALLVRATA